MGRFLCWLGFHKWRIQDHWYPSYDAPIIIRWEHECICVRCGRDESEVSEFDPVVGRPPIVFTSRPDPR